jgi:hypothetical protein
MENNPYLDGRLNIGASAKVEALHKPKPRESKPKRITGKDLRAGKGGK